MTATRANVCARLVHIPNVAPNERYATQGKRPGRVDICGKASGHGEPEHQGQYHGVRWTVQDGETKIAEAGASDPPTERP